MAKSRSRRNGTRRRSKSRGRGRTRNMKGGNGAATFMERTVGGMGQQHTGQNGSIARMSGGGSKRRRRSKKGGFLGPIISQAAVPFSVLGLQKWFR